MCRTSLYSFFFQILPSKNLLQHLFKNLVLVHVLSVHTVINPTLPFLFANISKLDVHRSYNVDYDKWTTFEVNQNTCRLWFDVDYEPLLILVLVNDFWALQELLPSNTFVYFLSSVIVDTGCCRVHFCIVPFQYLFGNLNKVSQIEHLF